MASIQGPTIGTRSLSTDPRLTVRLLRNPPADLRNLPQPMTPNELVGVFNGLDLTVRLYLVSGDGRALIPITS